MLILGIDPGPIQSGWCLYCNDDNTGAIRESGTMDNIRLLEYLSFLHSRFGLSKKVQIGIESITSYGFIVGQEVFDTCVWIGRFQQAWPVPQCVTLIPRRQVKEYMCAGNPKATDMNVRHAIIEMFPATGLGKVGQIGTKAKPGPLYDVTGHAWSALAVCLTLSYRLRPKIAPRVAVGHEMTVKDPHEQYEEHEITCNGPVVRQTRFMATNQGVATNIPNPHYTGEKS